MSLHVIYLCAVPSMSYHHRRTQFVDHLFFIDLLVTGNSPLNLFIIAFHHINLLIDLILQSTRLGAVVYGVCLSMNCVVLY